MNPVIDCLLSHRSIRKYKQRLIKPEKLKAILTAGTRAATAGNLQLYTFILVDDPVKLKELDDVTRSGPAPISKCAAAIIALEYLVCPDSDHRSVDQGHNPNRVQRPAHATMAGQGDWSYRTGQGRGVDQGGGLADDRKD